jgi:DNA polymerase elongation subunit (family B)
MKKVVSYQSFRLFDFHVADKTVEDTTKMTIQAFGINELGKTVSFLIEDFTPFFYIRVAKSWSSYDAQELLTFFQTKAPRHDILSCEIQHSKSLYGYTGNTEDTFVCVRFLNMFAFRRIVNLWYKYGENNVRTFSPLVIRGVKLELYESNIPPLLRYFHIHNLSPSGWVRAHVSKMTRPEIKTTTCNYEYCTLQKWLLPQTDKETPVPYKICSFDIEASSSHGDFPVPVKTYRRLAIQLVDILSSKESILSSPSLFHHSISCLIKQAFSFTPPTEVDIVYPKEIVTEQNIIQQLQTIFSIPPKGVKMSSCATKTLEEHFMPVSKESDEMDSDVDETSVAEDGADEASVEAEEATATQTLCSFYDEWKRVKTREERIERFNHILCAFMPELEGDQVTFIGSTFLRYGEMMPYLNHCLVVGSCDSVDHAVIESYSTENEILIEWTKLIQRENPDIIIGYNIFGFDWEFMFRRALENGCEELFLSLSRVAGHLSAKRHRDTDEYMLENTKIKLASGEYDLYYPLALGRVQIDLLQVFRKDFNLPSYKLDFVSSEFINDTIVKYEHGDETTRLYTKNITGLQIQDFIHIEFMEFSNEYLQNGEKYCVLDIDTSLPDFVVIVIPRLSSSAQLEMSQKKELKWGLTKDDVTPQEIFRLTRGSSADRAIVAKYCIQDCNIVHHLMQKIDILVGYIEMSRICSVPISFLVFRGQGIKLTSFVAKKCRENNTLMPDLQKTQYDDGYEGAIVLPPKSKIYLTNPVACLDYSSLYPSNMISQNFSHDTKVWVREYNLEGKLVNPREEQMSPYDNQPGIEYVDVEFNTYKYVKKSPTAKATKVKSGKRMVRWAQTFPPGILPLILKELLQARKTTKQLQKIETDEFMKNILDKRQNAYKITANSLYGQCGSKTSTFYEKDIASCTTAMGRQMITYAKRMIEEVYGNAYCLTEKHGPVLTKAEYVYGDSVAKYTPVYIRIANCHKSVVEIVTIEEVAFAYGHGIWQVGYDGKEYCELTNEQYDIWTWSDTGWTRLYRVIRHRLAKHKKIYRVFTAQGLVDVTDDHSLLTADGMPIPPPRLTPATQLMTRPCPTDVIYFREYEHYIKSITCQTIVCTQNQLLASRVFQLFSQYFPVFLIYQSDQQNYIVQCMPVTSTAPTSPVTMEQIHYPEEEYVYDLTTRNHHFSAGIGEFIVHNTDSVFFTFNLEHPETNAKIDGKTALEITIELAQEASKLCTKFLKPPMELAYEKTFTNFVLLAKKKYGGILYKTDANDGSFKCMGLSMKRRDVCDYFKDVYGGTFFKLMNVEQTNIIESCLTYIDEKMRELIEGRVPLDKLCITKSLRSHYKRPQSIGHKVLADRIGQRDPGNKPKSGDRIKYAFICTPHPKELMGNRMETPEYIMANGLTLDYNYYITNQLMKPLQQLLGLAIEDIWKFMNKDLTIYKFRKEMDELLKTCNNDWEIFVKKREKETSQRIKKLIFDKYLMEIQNKKTNTSPLTFYFGGGGRGGRK